MIPIAIMPISTNLRTRESCKKLASWEIECDVQVTLSWSSISRIKTPEAKACSVPESVPVPAK